VPRGTLSNYCERCGQRIDVHGARPGKVDLGLDRVGSVFRYCSNCQLFVGRACCWNPDVLACTHCVLPGSETSVTSASAVKARKEIALRGLADLRKSVDDLEEIALVLDAHTADGIALPSRQWDDAWEAAGWLITRADTTHDAVAKALAPPSGRARARFEKFDAELGDLWEAHLAARTSVEQRLKVAGQPRGPAASRKATRWLLSSRGWLRGWRRVPLLPSLLGAVLVVAGGLAAAVGAREMGLLGGQGNPEQTGATGGGAGVPEASAAGSDGASEPPTRSVYASLDFDLLRIGKLQGASDAITEVVGVAEVVPFPSPFDRSIRMMGSGAHRFCVSVPGLESRHVSVAVDLYAGSFPFGSVVLGAMPVDGPATTTGIPSELTARLLPGRWYNIDARWQPGMPVTIEIRQVEGGLLLSGEVPASIQAPDARQGALCLSASGMASDGELLLDNLRVEQ
jgi:hypothetical protein